LWLSPRQEWFPGWASSDYRFNACIVLNFTIVNTYIWGVVTFSALCLLAVGSHPWIRANLYSIFFHSHIVGLLVFMIGVAMSFPYDLFLFTDFNFIDLETPTCAGCSLRCYMHYSLRGRSNCAIGKDTAAQGDLDTSPRARFYSCIRATP
jgi:hypothetical protein